MISGISSRDVLAPLLFRPNQTWSNFWGALNPDGFYARAPDYLEIVAGKLRYARTFKMFCKIKSLMFRRKSARCNQTKNSNNAFYKRGLWNVPYISGAILMSRSVISNKKTRPSYLLGQLDSDMALCQNFREKVCCESPTNAAVEHYPLSLHCNCRLFSRGFWKHQIQRFNFGPFSFISSRVSSADLLTSVSKLLLLSLHSSQSQEHFAIWLKQVWVQSKVITFPAVSSPLSVS